ncbi:hypothetical protein CVT25_008496 [Psilocybe cyanescens]|uniref:Uncharacterized protein n=1 Tax=Psilocybe cyanescens TaxID=93625 RepID=A0A409XRN6_PSICY|nr:hypothetical protein CVT25_008496 [Psilocybe cyanescens]
MAGLKPIKVVPEWLEKITAVQRSNKWVAGMSVEIVESKEEALVADEADAGGVMIYADSSGLEGKIGAVAVLFKNGVEKWQAQYQLACRKDIQCMRENVWGQCWGCTYCGGSRCYSRW